MSDPVETVIETVQAQNGIAIPKSAAAAVVALATYGTYDLGHKAARKVIAFRQNRKAKKALKEQPQPTPQS